VRKRNYELLNRQKKIQKGKRKNVGRKRLSIYVGSKGLLLKEVKHQIRDAKGTFDPSTSAKRLCPHREVAKARPKGQTWRMNLKKGTRRGRGSQWSLELPLREKERKIKSSQRTPYFHPARQGVGRKTHQDTATKETSAYIAGR